MSEEGAPVRSFTELIAWQKARIVRLAIAKLARQWPADEKHRLTDQILRSSRGPTANIAEGYGRFREKDNVRFCRIARASLYETQDHLSAAYDEGFITPAVLKHHWAMVEEAIKVLNGYIAYLQRMGTGSSVSEPAASYGMDELLFGPEPTDLHSNNELSGSVTDN